MATTPNLTIYDADQVTVAFGPVLLDGFADGEFVTIEPGSDVFTLYTGTDGKVARSKTLRRDALVTIKLMQESAGNDALSLIHILDRDAPNGAGIHSLYIRDRGGRALYTAQQAWIEAVPSVSYDRETTVREWKIRCAKLERIDGGN